MPETTPATVEELLAQQQAQIEQLNAQLAETSTQLSLSQGTIRSQGQQIHTDTVAKKMQKLRHLPPAVQLAAQAIYLKDFPGREDAGSDGLNLSVQVAKPGGAQGEAEERTLNTATEIADFLLSAFPAGDGADAAKIATVMSGLDAINLAGHDAANGTPEAREAQAKAAVDEWERAHYPERFDEDGKRVAA